MATTHEPLRIGAASKVETPSFLSPIGGWLPALEALAWFVFAPPLVLASRASLVALIVLPCAWLVRLIARRDGCRRFPSDWPLLSVGYLGPQRPLGWLLGSSVSTSLSVQERLEVWNRAVYLIRDFPHTGVGLNTFPVVANLLYPFSLISSTAAIALVSHISSVRQPGVGRCVRT